MHGQAVRPPDVLFTDSKIQVLTAFADHEVRGLPGNCGQGVPDRAPGTMEPSVRERPRGTKVTRHGTATVAGKCVGNPLAMKQAKGEMGDDRSTSNIPGACVDPDWKRGRPWRSAPT